MPGDLNDYLDPYLDCTINGVKYRIAEPGAKLGLRIRRLFTDPRTYAALTDSDYLELIATLLGATWVADTHEETIQEWVPKLDDEGNQTVNDRGDVLSVQVPKTITVDDGEYQGGVWSEMIANDATLSQIYRAGQTALLKIGQNSVVAEAYWTDNANPKAQTPNRAQRRTAKNSPKESKGSTAGTTRGRVRTTKKTPAAANPTP